MLQGDERVLAAARAKRLIFTITTGRSGTEYLSHALACFRDVDSRHEPKPTFGSAFRTICSAPATAREFWLAHKLPRIAASKQPIYAETSHLVCKGFLESAVDLNLRMSLLHLVRAPREVATSLWRLATIPGRTYGGVKYYLSPWDARLALPVDLARAERWNDYQLCFWYCLEIEARAREYARRFEPRGVRVHRVELPAILATDGVEGLGRELELGPLGPLGRLQLRTLPKRRLNEKADRKREFTLGAGELDALESEVLAATESKAE
jgi:hypothetical protein